MCETRFLTCAGLILETVITISTRSTALLELSLGSTVFLSISKSNQFHLFQTRKLQLFEYLVDIHKWEKLHLLRQTPKQLKLFQQQACCSYLWPSTVHKDTPHSSGLNLASWGM